MTMISPALAIIVAAFAVQSAAMRGGYVYGQRHPEQGGEAHGEDGFCFC